MKNALSLMLLLAACGSDDDSGGPNPPGSGTSVPGCNSGTATSTTSVSLVGMAFSPNCLAVSSGQVVTFTNDDSVAHTVTTDPGQPETFDSGTLAPGASFTHTFSGAAIVNIHCTLHPTMKLSVLVDGGGTGSSDGDDQGGGY